MHQDHQEIKYDECLICQKPILKDISFIHLIHSFCLCKQCMDCLEVLSWHFYFDHYPMTILYSYNDFFKSLLFQYKGRYDYLLKYVFLDLFKEELKEKYKDYIIVPIPSSNEDNQARGFSPMEEISRSIFQDIFLGLYKKQRYKQSDMPYHLRNQNNHLLQISSGELLTNKKVLIIDDVITSGNTIKSALKLIELYHPNTIEILILSSKRSKDEIDHFI